MRRGLLVLFVCVGCGAPSQPSQPASPPPSATLITQGSLSVENCVPLGSDRYDCAQYAGTLKNTGTGCAQHIQGVTTAYVINSQTEVGRSTWTLGTMLRPNDTATYTGNHLIVAAPLTGGWTYATTSTWDAVACP